VRFLGCRYQAVPTTSQRSSARWQTQPDFCPSSYLAGRLALGGENTVKDLNPLSLCSYHQADRHLSIRGGLKMTYGRITTPVSPKSHDGQTMQPTASFKAVAKWSSCRGIERCLPRR